MNSNKRFLVCVGREEQLLGNISQVSFKELINRNTCSKKDRLSELKIKNEIYLNKKCGKIEILEIRKEESKQYE